MSRGPVKVSVEVQHSAVSRSLPGGLRLFVFVFMFVFVR